MRQSIRSAATTCLVAGCLAATCNFAVADDKAAAKSPEAMMMEWMKLNAVGPEQAELAKAVGTWKAVSKFKTDANAPEMESTGEEVCEMILNGRILQGKFKGEMMGQPYHGLLLTGYDSVQKKHFSVWFDDSSNGVMFTEGPADPAGKVITLKGKTPCPAKNMELVDVRQVLTKIDDDHHRMEMFTVGADDKEFRAMVIEYTRVK